MSRSRSSGGAAVLWLGRSCVARICRTWAALSGCPAFLPLIRSSFGGGKLRSSKATANLYQLSQEVNRGICFLRNRRPHGLLPSPSDPLGCCATRLPRGAPPCPQLGHAWLPTLRKANQHKLQVVHVRPSWDRENGIAHCT